MRSSIWAALRLQGAQNTCASTLGAFPSQPTRRPLSSRDRSLFRRSLNTRQSSEPSGMTPRTISLVICPCALQICDAGAGRSLGLGLLLLVEDAQQLEGQVDRPVISVLAVAPQQEGVFYPLLATAL